MTIAEEMASRDALRNLFGTTLNRAPLNYSQPLPLTQKDFEEKNEITDLQT